MSNKHSEQTELHRIDNWQHANAAARTGEAVTSGDLGKVSWQQDDDTLYLLGDTGPTWINLSGDTGTQGDTGDPGDTGVAGPQGDTGVAGAKGDTGADGAAAADVFAFPYDFNTTTTSPPSSGEIRFNNATYFDATVIWVHDTDRDAVDRDKAIDLLQVGDTLWIKAEGDNDQVLFEITETTDSGTYHTFGVIAIDDSGSFTNGEDITLVPAFTAPTAAVRLRDRLSQASHTDTTWYTVLTLGPYADSTFGLNIIVSGHSDDAATASWVYVFPAWVRNDGGTVTGGMGTLDNVNEYDAAYEAQAVASGSSLLIQVRRNGGSDYAIEWAVTAQMASYMPNN
jgi:hypothetical protein